MNDWASLVFAGIVLFGLGLILGSFGNVVIARVPEGKSVVRPRSACPACGTQILGRDNIPVISWLILRARCRACGERISARYPLVELSAGVLFVLLGWWAWQSDSLGLLPLLLAWGLVGLCLAMIDVDHHRLPDALTLPMLLVTPAGLLLAQLLGDDRSWLDAAWGVVIWLGAIGGLWALSRGRGMGLGDVKLAPSLGALLGWIGLGSAVVGLLAAFIVGALIGITLMLVHRAGRRSRIAFGPFLLLGTLIGVLVGEPISAAYWSGFVG